MHEFVPGNPARFVRTLELMAESEVLKEKGLDIVSNKETTFSD